VKRISKSSPNLAPDSAQPGNRFGIHVPGCSPTFSFTFHFVFVRSDLLLLLLLPLLCDGSFCSSPKARCNGERAITAVKPCISVSIVTNDAIVVVDSILFSCCCCYSCTFWRSTRRVCVADKKISLLMRSAFLLGLRIRFCVCLMLDFHVNRSFKK